MSIFQCEFTLEPMQLPEPVGEVITKHEKVYVPVKLYPEVRKGKKKKRYLNLFSTILLVEY